MKETKLIFNMFQEMFQERINELEKIEQETKEIIAMIQKAQQILNKLVGEDNEDDDKKNFQ